jgi:hypothetical protein
MEGVSRKKKSNENKNELLEPNNTKGVCWRVRILSPAEAIVSRLYRLYFLLTHFAPNDDISKIFYASRDRWKGFTGNFCRKYFNKPIKEKRKKKRK